MSSAEVSSLQAEEKAEGDDESWLYGGKSHCQLEVCSQGMCVLCVVLVVPAAAGEMRIVLT